MPLCKTRVGAEPCINKPQRGFSQSSVEEEITAIRTIRDGSLKEVVFALRLKEGREFSPFELGRGGGIFQQRTLQWAKSQRQVINCRAHWGIWLSEIAKESNNSYGKTISDQRVEALEPHTKEMPGYLPQSWSHLEGLSKSRC